MTARDRIQVGYQPDFDIDAEAGSQGVLWVASTIDALRDGTVEVKRDYSFSSTGNIFV